MHHAAHEIYGLIGGVGELLLEVLRLLILRKVLDVIEGGRVGDETQVILRRSPEDAHYHVYLVLFCEPASFPLRMLVW